MSQGLQASPQSAGLSFPNGHVLGRLDDLRQVEAKYPALAALLFEQKLTGFLENIYGLIRDNLKKELRLCIRAPKSLVKGQSRANAAAQQALIAHWQSIVNCLDNYLKMMKANYVPPFLVQKYVGSAWDELKLIRQAVGFLVIHQKPKKTLHEIANELCPVLSIEQLYRISTMYWMTNMVPIAFLMSIPFTVDDIYLKR